MPGAALGTPHGRASTILHRDRRHADQGIEAVTDTRDAPARGPFLLNELAPNQIVQLARSGALPSDATADLVARLRAELSAISAFVPGVVLRQQIERPTPGQVSGTFWDGTTLFADMSGFTALSGRLSTLGKQGAEEISALINALFGALVAEVHRHGGEVLKFGGDALTVFFDQTALGPTHAALAARAAMMMQERMVWFRAIETRGGTFALKLRVGVHSGRIFAAQVGDEAHIELVVTGREINHVALAQEIAEPGEVVASGETLSLVPGADSRPRRDGFFRLDAAPALALPLARRRWEDHLPAGTSAEAVTALAERVAALRPYLPYRLPRRFLEPSESAGELRPVSVLFANFAPFSELLESLADDPDTAAQALNAYYRRVQLVIHRYDGIVNKVDMAPHGDKLMALFGAPAAHENDPERATRAALELRATLEEANNEIAELLSSDEGRGMRDENRPHPSSLIPHPLTQKIGINTGVVYAGLVGTSSRHEYTVMGQPVNLAARMMSVAQEGGIVVSPTTRRQIEGRFALRDLPPAQLKGVAEPVPLAEPLHPLDASPDARRALASAALVGRDNEQRRIIAEAREALAGSGQVAALVGEAGAGKSRLIDATIHRLTQLTDERLTAGADAIPAFMIYTAECQSYDQQTPYATIRALLRQILSLELYGAEAGAALARHVAEAAPELARFTPLLGDVLGLPLDATPLTAALSPAQRHDRAHDLVEALVLAETRAKPLVLVMDDLHWCDATSLELIERIVQAAPSAPLLLLLAYRSDTAMPEPWRELPHVTRLLIEELPPSDAAALVRELLGGTPPAGLERLVEKAQGNPFFIEEVVRTLVDSGVLARDGETWRLTREPDEVVVPDSIEGLIVARLDRLEERSREVVQVGAVIGRRFGYNVLARLMPRRDDLPERLEQLSDEDLLLAEAEGLSERDLAGLIYLFKHALTRDVAYDAILFARRRELHRRVAREIESIHAGRLDEQLALLARHELLAEEWPRAFDYHLRAGRLAQGRYANREAITLLERALEIAPRLQQAEFGGLGDGAGQSPAAFDDRIAALLEIHERLGAIRALVGEYDAALVRYNAALTLLGTLPDAAAEVRVRLHHHIARVYEKRAEFDVAFAWVERALALDATPSAERASCLLLGAGLHQRQGRYQQSLEWGERALALAAQIGSARDQAEATMLLGGTYSYLGAYARAHELTERSLRLYVQVQDLPRLADAYNNLALFAQELGRLDEARDHYEAGAAIKEQIGDVYGQAMIANNLGLLLSVQGDLDGALEQYRRSLAMFERLGSLYATGVLHMNLGAVLMQRGALDAAAEHLRHSATLFERAGAEDFLPELERYQAELAFHRGDLVAARIGCELAITTARRLEALVEEALTRRLLARVLEHLDDHAGAWHVLQSSLATLREAGSPLEIARTLVALAALAPDLGAHAQGQAALAEALPIFAAIGARRDLEEAKQVALRYGYMLA
jgi:class 3 adenylate cyclase/tetratricopeptide (TPR) repeat protein